MLAPPADLTIPEEGSTTARAVLSQAIGRLLRELALLARAHGGPLDRMVRAAPPGALASALRRPTVAGPLRCLRAAVPDQLAELTAQLAFDLAVAGAIREPIELSLPATRLLSIPARLALTVPAASRVTFEPGRVTLDGRGISLHGPGGERPYHPIARETVLALADNNPLALVDAHPDKSGNAIDLGGRSADVWCAELAAALAPIERHMPELRDEMNLYVAQVVPVGWDTEKHLSASYQEIIGTVYMTLHPSRMTLTEALIHEASHNKLNALFELDGVIENAFTPLYTSPVRPDPRPLHGVLLAVHAFLPVARLYEKMIEAGEPIAQREDFRARYADIRRVNREGAELVLREARPTSVGAGLLGEIRRWHEHFLDP